LNIILVSDSLAKSRSVALSQTQVYSSEDNGSDAVVQRIIAANLAGAVPALASGAKGTAAPAAKATAPGAAVSAVPPQASVARPAAVAMSGNHG